MPLSEKQKQSIRECIKRDNLWVGAIRSGKTFSSILAFWEALKSDVEGDVMIIGVSRATIQRNVLKELYTVLGSKDKEPGEKVNKTRLYGRDVYFVGAHDESAVRDIKGATLAFAYVDELTCIPEAVWKELIGRLSMPNARLFATCNPEGPAHWVKKTLIDRASERDLVYWNFNLNDNPSLEEGYKDHIKKEYQGSHWYKRLILGEWAASSGAVYDGFSDDNIYTDKQSNPNYYIAALDYGTINATCCLVAGVTPKMSPQIQIEAEYYYDSAKMGRSKSDNELALDIKNFISWRPIQALYVDPSAASLKIELSNLGLPVIDAKNDVLPGIQVVNKFVYNKNLAIHKSCTNLIEQMQSYQWDPKSIKLGEDRVLKVNDHAVDACRYLCYSKFTDGKFDRPAENMTIDQIRREVYGIGETFMMNPNAGF